MNISPALAARYYSTPWLLEPATALALSAYFGGRGEPLTLAGDLADLFTRPAPLALDENGIATVSIRGPLAQDDAWNKLLGGTNYEDVAGLLEEAEAQGATGVLLVADSPGGEAVGCQALAEQIASLNTRIPVEAFVSGQACSACYMLLAGVPITAGLGSMLGSIGVIIPFVNEEEAWRQAGYKEQFITSGPLKGAGMGPALSEAQAAHFQEVVDDLYAVFTEHIGKYRRVDPDAMQGQSVTSGRALSYNLADQEGQVGDAYANLLERAQG